MKLHTLKQHVWDEWCQIHQNNRVLVQPETFKPEMRQHGDLRCKTTWEKALARLVATQSHQNCLDAWTLIVYDFNFEPDDPYYEYRHLIIDEFLAYQDGLELLRLGFEQLLVTQADIFTNEEKETAHGVYRLVGETQRGTDRSFPDHFVGAVRSIGSARAT